MLPELPLHSSIIVLLAVTLGLLNPLLCIAHCAVVARQPAPRSAASRFVCHLGIVSQAPADTGTIGASPASPRAFYEGALALSSIVIVLLPLMLLKAADDAVHSSDVPPPPAPPPKRYPSRMPSGHGA